MSEFSEAFDLAFEPALDVFGDVCTLHGEEYDCIIHGFESEQIIRAGTAGRTQVATGSVILKLADWLDVIERLTADARKLTGIRITIPQGEFRITNQPGPGYTSDSVELVLGPLNAQ